jgi:hypothetical protein
MKEEKSEQKLDIQMIEEFIDTGYEELNFWYKITYHLQDYVWLAILVGVAGGYLAGMTFGKFW